MMNKRQVISIDLFSLLLSGLVGGTLLVPCNSRRLRHHYAAIRHNCVLSIANTVSPHICTV